MHGRSCHYVNSLWTFISFLVGARIVPCSKVNDTFADVEISVGEHILKAWFAVPRHIFIGAAWSAFRQSCRISNAPRQGQPGHRKNNSLEDQLGCELRLPEWRRYGSACCLRLGFAKAGCCARLEITKAECCVDGGKDIVRDT